MSWIDGLGTSDRPTDLAVALLSRLMQWLAHLDLRWIAALGAGMLLIAYVGAHLLQSWLIRQLKRHPARPAPLLEIEGTFSIIGVLVFLVRLAVRGFRSLYRWVRGARLKLTSKSRPDSVTQAVPGPKQQELPLLVATLGPTFFGAGLLTALLYWIGWLSGPLVARSLELTPGSSPWQFLVLGGRPEFGWLLPLEDHPRLAFILTLFGWLLVWWTLGNFLRALVYSSSLARNLVREKGSALPSWYSAFGVEGLIQPASSYSRWAAFLIALGILLTAVAGATFDREHGAVSPAAFSVALVTLLSWLLHLRLRGFERGLPKREQVASDKGQGPVAGWPEVQKELKRRHRLRTPVIEAEGRNPPFPKEMPLSQVPTVSPLLRELISRSPTVMQAKVLHSLALSGYVYLDPPSQSSELSLNRDTKQTIEDLSGLSQRHQIVLAPEGSGKTTLAMLASANHALVHARATLMVTRSEAQAEQVYERFAGTVSASTVRWNLRVRRVGRDFAQDLSRDIIPDVVVCSLEQLVVGVLGNAEVYAPFLRSVGLLVIDDVDSFAGAVEIHAQLAFRRLHLLFHRLLDVEQLGEESAPLTLVLGVDSMKETAAWAKTLCGVQGAVRLFPAQAEEGTEEGLTWQSLRFNKLRAGSGRALSVQEVIEACEIAKAPWHYRPCGDGRRFRGRGPLRLDKEPEVAQEQPDSASIVILEGRWSEVYREWARLPWMGSRSGCPTVTVLTLLEPEEEAACEALVPSFGRLEKEEGVDVIGMAADMAMLPLPIVRPPTSAVVQAHLLADLTQHWVEVGDLVRAFENPVATVLRRLQQHGMLHVEERLDVQPELKLYEPRVYVRALASALEAPAEALAEEGVIELGDFDTVAQVELVSRRALLLRNRADHTVLRKVEADSAPLVYYPGRVFEDSRGRFVVVGRAGRGKEPGGAIEVEPALHDDVTSPRLEIKIWKNGDGAAVTRSVPEHPLFEPEAVLLGRDPIDIGHVSVGVEIQTVATYRLNRLTGEVHSRERHGELVRKAFRVPRLETCALLLRPNPKDLIAGAPRLRFREARLFAALLRFLLPMIYRDIRDHVEVALVLGGERTDEDFDLTQDEGIYVFDLHDGGNGTAWSIYREGLEMPLRFCRHFLEQVEDLERLRHLYDRWGDNDEILKEGAREEREREERQARAAEEAARKESVRAQEEVAEPQQAIPEVEAEFGVAAEVDAENEAEAELRDRPEELLSWDEPGAQGREERDGSESDWQPTGEPTVQGADETQGEPSAMPDSETAPASWEQTRVGLLAWLESRLHPEYVFAGGSGEPDEAAGDGEDEPAEQDSGEAA